MDSKHRAPPRRPHHIVGHRTAAMHVAECGMCFRALYKELLRIGLGNPLLADYYENLEQVEHHREGPPQATH